MNDSSPFESIEQPLWQRLWWVLLSFLAPFACGFFFSPPGGGSLVASAARSGLVGLGVAAIIFLLWRLDCSLGRAPQRSSAANALIYLLGAALWLVWLAAAHVFIMAYDEVNSPVTQIIRTF
jgi:hypothetical protein